MSTTPSSVLVKQGLREQLAACQRQLEKLAAQLPDALEDWTAAERQVRQGMLQIGRTLLQAWSETADGRVEAPECVECQERMRHKGLVSGQLVTTLGAVRCGGPAFAARSADARRILRMRRCGLAPMPSAVPWRR